MLRPSLRQRLALCLRGTRLGPEYWPWLERQLEPRRQLRVQLGLLLLVWVLPVVRAATGTWTRDALVVPFAFSIGAATTLLRRRSPEQRERARWYLGLPPYDQVAPPRRADQLAPFGVLGTVVLVSATLVLALGVGTVVDEELASDRCLPVPMAGSALVQRALETTAPAALVVTDPVSAKHPRLVGARRVDAAFPEGDYFVAAFVEVDGEGGREVMGPAVWRVVDPTAYGAPAGSFGSDLVLTSRSVAAHRLTPLTGLSIDPDPRVTKALSCLRRP